jgi:4-diphosphocytidyl-2-C-methyl-D-erythritol kinase
VRLTGLAPAKINLFLHVGSVQPDGYHPLASLVAFADVGDRVTVERADRLSLAVEGPFGEGLAAEPDNLILKALRTLGEAAGIGEPPLRVVLDKQLPIAAGLGGGSSDAGAALKLARDILALDLDDAALEAVAGVVGADGPMCLRARSAWAEGRGNRLTDAPDLRPLHAVLVNPGVPSSTGAVYRAFDVGPAGATERPGPPADWSPAAVIAWLAEQRNDLEPPALALTLAIGEPLAAMARRPGVGLTRMSGSGSTVFGLFAAPEDADRAAQSLGREHGQWWVRRTVLGGPASGGSL